ncbi:protein phosphatase 1 regulatory subunit 7 [Pancytospora epiphaga]|nr:protein phosphatase 1 regulatory subunit 7 [Pancytospora epiphaga]
MDKYDDKFIFIRTNLKLTEIPEIDANIKCVDLRKNRLEMICFPLNTMIEYIDLSDNLIKDIEPINSLSGLKVVDCSYNLVKRIPVIDLKELEELYLIANDIERIENISFRNLVKLDLAGNKIEVIENIQAESLQELYLATNKIKKVENLSHFNELKILDLQYNEITELDCNQLPQSLEEILLQGNSLLCKISNIERLKKLKMINYKGTRISHLNLGEDVITW